MRIYAQANCFEEWNRLFGWAEAPSEETASPKEETLLYDLRQVMDQVPQTGYSRVPKLRQCFQDSVITVSNLHVARSTHDFLLGQYAKVNGGWNNRLFLAACDLHARGISLEKAKPGVRGEKGRWDSVPSPMHTASAHLAAF